MENNYVTRSQKIKYFLFFLFAGLLWFVSFFGIVLLNMYNSSRYLNNYDSEQALISNRKLANNNSSDLLYYAPIETNIRSIIPLEGNSYFRLINTSNNGAISYVGEGDYKIVLNGVSQSYNYIFLTFGLVDNGFRLEGAYLRHAYGSSSNQYIIWNTATNEVKYTPFSVVGLSKVYSTNIIETSDLSCFNFYFNEVLNISYSYTYNFESGSHNLPQYLNSYNRMQYGFIQYSASDVNTDWLYIPMVFESNGILFDKIVISLRPAWFYINSAGEIIDTYSTTPSGTLIPYVCNYVFFEYYGKTIDVAYGDSPVSVVRSVSNGVLAMYLGYSGLSHQTSQNFYAPNYLVVQGLQVNETYSTIHVANVENIPFPNSTGSYLKPYNNLSIKGILEYFNYYGNVGGYNGSSYDVGLGNVFTLLSNAFQSLIPLMAIQIIPGITLGLLVLLPLVVTIILVILRLVKK